MMKNSDYWKKRFTVLENASHSYGQKTYSQIETAFIQAQKDIQGEIDKWYARFALNNGVTLTDAKKMLTSKELSELKWDVQQYIRHGGENAIDGRWAKQLENASARFHITRLEALQLRTQQAMEVAFGNQLDAVDKMARHILTEDYYHSIFEVQRGFNIGWDIGQIDEKKLEKLIVKPWAADGKNFSDRIWDQKQNMIGQLHQELTWTLIQGKAPTEAMKHLEQFVSGKFKNAKYAASRLVMTEQAYFHSVSQQQAFEELDVEEYEIIATLDSHTSAICQDMDGKHLSLKNYEAGVTAPPFHPNCRSVTAPYFEDNFGGMRAARGEDGKTYYVPDNTKYKDWKNKAVNGQDNDLTPGEKGGTIKAGTAKSIEEGVKSLESYAQSASLDGVTNLDAVNEMTGTLERLYQNYSLKKLDTITAKKSKKWLAQASYKTLDVNYLFMNDPVNEVKTATVDWISSNQAALKKYQGELKKYQETLERFKSKLGTGGELYESVVKENIHEYKRVIKEYEKAIHKVEERLKYSRHNVIYSGKEIQSTITHEFGHVIADQHCGQINGVRANPAYANNVNNEFWKKCELIRDTFKKAKANEDIYKISMYASTDSYEFFAECFAMYDIGEEELPKYIVEMIEAVIKE